MPQDADYLSPNFSLMPTNADVSRLACIGFLMDLPDDWRVDSSVCYHCRSPVYARHEKSQPLASVWVPSWLAAELLCSPPDTPGSARLLLLAMRGLSRLPASETPHGSPLNYSDFPYLPFRYRFICYLLLKIHNYPHFWNVKNNSFLRFEMLKRNSPNLLIRTAPGVVHT